jgi:hypothetical protein
MTPQDPQPPQKPPAPSGQGMPSQPQPFNPAARPPGPPMQGQPGPGRPPGPPFQGHPGPGQPPVQSQPGPGPVPPFQGPPGQGGPGPLGQPSPNRPDYQWQPAAPPPGTTAPAGVGAPAAAAKPAGQGLNGFLAAFRPEPAKAPPLEWVGLAVSVLLIICGFLPWVNISGGDSLSGIDSRVGDGWIVAGAGLVAAIMGFIGLSRDSISLAAGQALVGLIALGFAIVNITGLSSDEGTAFGLILTIVVAVIVIILGLYNAFDAFRKGAKY